MKRKQLWLVGLLVSVVCGCSHPEVNLKISPVELSAQENNLKLTFTRKVISSADPAVEKQCSLFNEHVNQFVTDLRDSLFNQLPSAEEGIAADTNVTPHPYEFWVSDTVFRATNHYISMRLTVYTYTGGAHGMTYFYAFNYDLRKQQFLDNARLLDLARKEKIEKLLKARLDNRSGCFTEAPTIDESTVLNFSTKELIFSYPPYALGPYSCGTAEIIVPREELGDAVKVRL
ncbi:MAG: DUF3298 and DUF4163 domain-containing protein [Odoribacteraceae bacterium]|nr:DUF3298 and DUF4163 domain-containing protein [Odoribacteraceae bacterium]